MTFYWLTGSFYPSFKHNGYNKGECNQIHIKHVTFRHESLTATDPAAVMINSDSHQFLSPYTGTLEIIFVVWYQMTIPDKVWLLMCSQLWNSAIKKRIIHLKYLDITFTALWFCHCHTQRQIAHSDLHTLIRHMYTSVHVPWGP